MLTPAFVTRGQPSQILPPTWGAVGGPNLAASSCSICGVIFHHISSMDVLTYSNATWISSRSCCTRKRGIVCQHIEENVELHSPNLCYAYGCSVSHCQQRQHVHTPPWTQGGYHTSHLVQQGTSSGQVCCRDASYLHLTLVFGPSIVGGRNATQRGTCRKAGRQVACCHTSQRHHWSEQATQG